jgi:hypothetical protein
MIATSTTLKPVRGRGRKAYVPTTDAPKTSRPLLRAADPDVRDIETLDDLLRFACKTLEALRGILHSLPAEVGKKFVAAYSQHYAYSVNHGERPTAPLVYYSEWKEVQENGELPMNTEHPGHERRHYHVYDTPLDTFVGAPMTPTKKRARAKARAALGLDAETGRMSPRKDARRVLGLED